LTPSKNQSELYKTIDMIILVWLEIRIWIIENCSQIRFTIRLEYSNRVTFSCFLGCAWDYLFCFALFRYFKHAMFLRLLF
jgi:hypothetical protein